MSSIKEAKRIVIKVGSSLLVEESTGALHHAWLQSLVTDIVSLLKSQQQVILVSSGAIALGREELLSRKKHLQLAEKQAAAAIGQIKLAHAYQHEFAQHDKKVAQILLTLEDSENRQRYLNAKNTLETLLASGVVPIINENDTVATQEIRYGDNDRLAAHVAQMVSADVLILLSDIDGLYTANPRENKDALHIPLVTQLTPEILQMAANSSTCYGSGGMITKLAAAKIALASGCKMLIATGQHLSPITKAEQDVKKTWFVPQVSPQNARKNWIAHHLKTKGQLFIDQGAARALSKGKSLLSAGIVAISGDFQKGDPVSVFNEERQEIARGLVNYSALDAKKILGMQSSQFEAILGYSNSDEMIHRDDLTYLLGE